MRIESLSRSAALDHQAHQPEAAGGATRPKPRGRTVEDPAVDAAVAIDEPTPYVDDVAEKTRGVIGLIESGHFKGVADVRLRINFFEELQARAGAATVATLPEKADALLAEVRATLTAFVSSRELSAEQQQAVDEAAMAFETALGEAVEQFTASATPDLDALTDAVQTAFDALVEQLFDSLSQTAVPPEAPSPIPNPIDPGAETASAQNAVVGSPTSGVVPEAGLAVDSGSTIDPAVPDDSVPEPVTPFDDALAALSEELSEVLAGFLDAVNSAYQLPDPSAQSGNGAAYDRFLAIYDSLRGLTVDQTG